MFNTIAGCKLFFAALSAACLCTTFLQKTYAIVPDVAPMYIDAGNPTAYTDPVTGIVWQGDVGFAANGTSMNIASTNLGPFTNLSVVDQTLQIWKSGDSCYEVPVAEESGRYLVRLSFCYNNYDNQYQTLRLSGNLPTVGVAIEDFFVEAVSDFKENGTSYYTDYLVTVDDGSASICLFPLQSTADGYSLPPPFINSLQIIPVDSGIYGPEYYGSVLSNWVRINAGGSAVVPTAANNQGNRTWKGDFPANSNDAWTQLRTETPVQLADTLSIYGAPAGMLQTARQAGGPSTGYVFKNIHPVDQSNQFLVVFYLAEIDPTVQPGDRVFNIWCNGKYLRSMDLARDREVSGGSIQQLVVPLTNVTETEYDGWTGVITVLLYTEPNVTSKPPILNGLEIYEIIEPESQLQVAEELKLRIDCGADQNYTDPFGNAWMVDSFYSSGGEGNVLSPGTSLRMATTLRFFEPTISGRQNCYAVPVDPGLYLVRAYFVYGNWDLDPSKESATFSIAVEGVSLVRIKPGTPGFFESILTPVSDGEVNFCLYLDVDEERPPFINSLEVLQVNDSAYASTSYNTDDYLMYTYYRLTAGEEAFGDGISSDTERGMRQWLPDNSTITFKCSPECVETAAVAANLVAGTDTAPNFWPPQLFTSNREVATEGSISYTLEGIVPGVDVILYLHFAELNQSVAENERVFGVYINGSAVELTNVATGDKFSTVDVVAISGGNFTALDMFAAVKVPEASDGSKQTSLTLTLQSVDGSKYGPMVSGIEVMGAFPTAAATDPTELSSMESLRDSLKIGEGLAWQGDPCVPVPWTGLKCVQEEGSSYVTVIELPGVGIDGYLSEDLSGLERLVTLNLSSNSLSGSLPEDYSPLDSLVTVDLSNNNFNGSIPEGLASLPSLKILYLQDNNFEGSVPADLNPAPSALTANLTGNPNLCGATNLPECANVPGPSGLPLAPPTKTSSGGGGSSSIGAIVGGLIGGIVLVAIIGAVVILVLRKKKKKASPYKESLESSGVPPRKSPYWRSRSGEFEMMNPGPEV